MISQLVRKADKAWRALPDPIWRRALLKGVAPSFEHATLMQSLAPIRTVVDVGANTGQFALLSLRVFPEAKIHSFEPIKAIGDRFQDVTAGEDRITLHRCALGAEAAKAEINLTARADSSSLLSPELQAEVFPGTHKVGTETVRVTPLETEISAEQITGPALLKIDVQGFEGEVLKGCETLLSRFDWIFVELSFVELYRDQPLADDVIAWLRERGFGLDGVYMDAMSYSKGRAVQGDFLFRRAEQGAE